MTMNSRQAQVIDPILSTQSRGYTNQDFIGTELLPWADIPSRSMKVIRFGKEAFRQYINTRRAPGSATRRLTFGYESDPVSLRQDSLEAVVPDEISGDARNVPGIDLAAVSVRGVQDIIGLGREVEIATLVRAPSLYAAGNKTDLSGGGKKKWTAADSDPGADIRAGRDAVRRMIGRYPNVLAIGPDVFNALTGHEAIQERFKYTSSDSITTAMLAKYFDLDEVLVGKAVALPEGANDKTPATDVWGKDAVLAYVPRGTGNILVPAFGYTYRLSGYPVVEQPYPERNIKSWVYPVTEEFRPYVTGAEGGYLIQNAV